MICGNDKCKRKVEQPLELYDGSWACPYCKHEIASMSGNFRITAENEELFTLAERSYFSWLTMSVSERRRSGKKTLEKAVELCKEAARQGNPLAVTRLGYYYDKDYVEVNRSEAVRCRIAYAYYSAVCFSDAQLAVDESVGKTYDWQEIRIAAANLMLEMLAFVPEEIAVLDKFNFEYNRSRVRAKLGLDYQKQRSELMKHSRSEQAFSTLYSCFAKVRAPLFGVCRLSGEELKKLFTETVGNKLDAYRMAEKGVFMSVAECDKKGSLLDGGAAFSAMTNRRRIDEILSSLGGESEVYFFFFNGNGGHKYFGRHEQNQIADVLRADRYELVRRLVSDAGRQDYTFFDDDVYYYKAKFRGAGDAVKKLITAVCGGE